VRSEIHTLESGELLGQIIRTSGEAGIRCHEVFYPRSTQLAKHAHQSAFFGLSMDGVYTEFAAGTRFDCPPRTAVFHRAQEEHAISIGEKAVRAFVIEIDPDEVERWYEETPSTSVVHMEGGPLAALLDNAYREFRHPDSSSAVAIQGLVLQLLAGVSRNEGDAEPGRPTWLERVSELLHERFCTTITLAEIAAEVGVAAARVSATFRRVHQRSIAEEQRRLRIEFACARLRECDRSLADIAAEAGFSDQPHFSRVFKQLTGMTPALYRSMFRSSDCS
jgi:AraC family transcriptional regulator